MKKGRDLCREGRGPTFQEQPSRERIWRIGPSGATQAGQSSAQPALSQPYSLVHRGHMTAEQQLKKLNKIHLGTVPHGFHPRTVLIVAKGSVTALDFLPDDRQVVVWSGTPQFERIVWVPPQAALPFAPPMKDRYVTWR